MNSQSSAPTSCTAHPRDLGEHFFVGVAPLGRERTARKHERVLAENGFVRANPWI